jgi:hypothetical protein
MWSAPVHALRAVFYQKWLVHRRVRPETFGGRIHNHVHGRGEISDSRRCSQLGCLAGDFQSPRQLSPADALSGRKPDAPGLGELNKLAANVSLGREACGVHYRSDGVEGMRLGEAIALSILGDLAATYNEQFPGCIGKALIQPKSELIISSS